MNHSMTRSDLCVSGLCIVVFTALVAAMTPHLHDAGRVAKDSSQQTGIYRGLVVHAAGNNGQFPTPGDVVARVTKEPSFLQNHTANLFSLMIATGDIGPDFVVSPVEVSGLVSVYKEYDYNEVQPAQGRFWDSHMMAFINDKNYGSNVSYAHASICGERRTKQWRNTTDANYPMISTRGVEGGATEGPKYDGSITLKMVGDGKRWKGNVVFADAHAAQIDTFTPDNVRYSGGGGERRKDNIFAAEFSHEHGAKAAADAFLTVSVAASEYAVKDVYDTQSASYSVGCIRCAKGEPHDPRHIAHSREERRKLEKEFGCCAWDLVD